MFCSDYYDVELSKYKIKTERWLWWLCRWLSTSDFRQINRLKELLVDLKVN